MAITNMYHLGCDEVGRGPLAGPVTVTCLALPHRYSKAYFRRLEKNGVVPALKDSKQLNPAMRDRWYTWIQQQTDIYCTTVSISAHTIDALGITNAANNAATSAYTSLCKKIEPHTTQTLRLDHGLTVKNAPHQRAYIKGDERFPEIALASIVAKVTRDRLMAKLDKLLPMYSFAKHKGYGTLAHRKAIQSHGLSNFHRKSFCKNTVR